MKNILLACALLISAQSYAQYNFSLDTMNYQSLIGANSLNSTTNWTRDSSYVLNFGFNFTWDNHTDTALTVIAGGGISFPGNGNKKLRVFSHTDSGYLLEDRNNTNSISTISYKIEGNSGNKILKIEWKNAGFRDFCATSNTNDFVNFQLWMYEMGSLLEIHFGPFVADSASYGNPSCNTGSYGPQILLQHNSCSSVLGLTGPSSYPQATYRNHCFWQPSVSLNGTPPNGAIYRFSPIATSIEKAKRNGSFKIYPNPVEKNFSIQGLPPDFNIEQVEILSLSGKRLFFSTNNSKITGRLSLSVNDLKEGTYFLKITSEENRVLITKFIKI